MIVEHLSSVYVSALIYHLRRAKDMIFNTNLVI